MNVSATTASRTKEFFPTDIAKNASPRDATTMTTFTNKGDSMLTGSATVYVWDIELTVENGTLGTVSDWDIKIEYPGRADLTRFGTATYELLMDEDDLLDLAKELAINYVRDNMSTTARIYEAEDEEGLTEE
jgi:hypothetical protein